MALKINLVDGDSRGRKLFTKEKKFLNQRITIFIVLFKSLVSRWVNRGGGGGGWGDE